MPVRYTYEVKAINARSVQAIVYRDIGEDGPAEVVMGSVFGPKLALPISDHDFLAAEKWAEERIELLKRCERVYPRMP